MSASIPVRATDATRVEALGPPLGALLVSQLRPGKVWFRGDNVNVVGELQRRFRPRDV